MRGKRKRKHTQGLEVIHPDCAGIDIGSRSHWVAIDPLRFKQPVRNFEAHTDGLEALADWLVQNGIRQVAMEATGVYWIAPYELLAARGLQVELVDTRATRQVSGRKSDVLDCQWIWQLMRCGLLRSAFRPAQRLCELRALVRLRAQLVRDLSRSVLHMQKALTQMNIQLAHTVSTVTGKTGMAILRAIVAGERDTAKLAALRDRRLKADAAALARSLRGNWRPEHLFALRQALERYDFLNSQAATCETQIAKVAKGLICHQVRSIAPTKPMRAAHRSAAADEDLRQTLHGILGVDLTAIPTIAVETALTLCAEIGPDLTRFPDCAHFCAWLQLAPPTRITGGKPLPGHPPSRFNRAGQAIRQAAANARRSNSFIGAAHRARLARTPAAAAIKATAHQLARLIYAMLTQGQAYVEKGVETYEQLQRERRLDSLQRSARRFGFTLTKTPLEQAA